MNKKPNFLFFITDQQRADYLGCYGHPVLKTPNIDGLAQRGTRFDKFYVATPICMPNRATLMTGRMPSLHKVRSNGIPLSLKSVTFVELLRHAGYRTALIGKSHLQNFGPFPPMLPRPVPRPGHDPAPAELAEATRLDPHDGPYDQEHPKRWQGAEPLTMTLPFYGFEQVDLCTDHGDQVGGHYYQWLRARRPDADALRDHANQLPHGYVSPQAIRTPIPEELYPTAYIADRAVDCLDRYAEGDRARPFFTMVSFPDPHHPFTPPGRYWGMYDPADMVLPKSFAAPATAPHVAWVREERAAGRAVTSSQNVFAVDEREAREAMALTCGMIAMIDDAVGRVLATLRQRGLADDTVIVFTSDHGDFLGDHRLMLKGPMHYRSIIRVPFIWCDPAAPGGAVDDGMAGTLDIAQTVLDRAALQPANGMQGRSLLADPPPGDMLIEEDGQRAILGFDRPPRLRSIVTAEWRLSLYHDADWGELYDLAADPEEAINLWDNPAHAGAKAELLERLARKQMALADVSPFPMGRA